MNFKTFRNVNNRSDRPTATIAIDNVLLFYSWWAWKISFKIYKSSVFISVLFFLKISKGGLYAGVEESCSISFNIKEIQITVHLIAEIMRSRIHLSLKMVGRCLLWSLKFSNILNFYWLLILSVFFAITTVAARLASVGSKIKILKQKPLTTQTSDRFLQYLQLKG